MEKKPHLFTTLFIFTMMILAAIAENTRGVFVPSFKNDFGITDTEIGFVLTMCTVGYSIATFVGGWICDRIGQRIVFISGIITMIGSLILLSLSNSYLLFIISMTLTSCGLGLSAITINTLIPILFISMQSIIMNLVHFCYGLGSTVGQRAAGVLMYNGIEWRKIYLGVAVLYVIMLILFSFIKIPKINKGHNNARITLKEALSNKIVLLYICVLGFYVFAEGGTSNWFVNYMESSFNFNKSQSSLYLSIFFAIFSIGRLFGGFVVEKRGYLNVVLKSLTIALILYTLGFIMGENGVLVIGVSGIFFAIAFPTVVLSISKVFNNGSTYITGIIVTFATFINMAMTFLMGIANDMFGTRYAFALIPLS
ncbi:sugar MFS transporter [Clostridium sp.]|uniref:sugar MFS transporter n=1 Tax=Clostridium sp. TaxID=1506 RepID=UPI003464297C